MPRVARPMQRALNSWKRVNQWIPCVDTGYKSVREDKGAYVNNEDAAKLITPAGTTWH